MSKQPKQNEEQAVDSLLRDFGIKPNEETRENLRQHLEQEREKFVTVERIRGKDRGRDLSR